MLETIREYAVERLDASPDADETYRRHGEYFLAVAVDTNLNAGILRPGPQRFDLAVAERDNFRGALAWSLRSKSPALGLSIATELEQLWTLDDPNEGVRWFERLFQAAEGTEVPPALRAEAVRAHGSSLGLAGQWPAAEDKFKRSLAMFEELGDEHGRAVLLHRVGATAALRGGSSGRHASSSRRATRSTGAGRRLGPVQTTGSLGAIARDEGDQRRAVDLVRERRARARDRRSVVGERGARRARGPPASRRRARRG